MRAGLLRHRIAIEKPGYTQDPMTGEMVAGWTVVHESVPASVEPLSAREFIAAAATQSQITARIVIRHMAGITPDMRIRYGAAVYNIHGVLADKDSGREYLTLPVSEVRE